MKSPIQRLFATLVIVCALSLTAFAGELGNARTSTKAGELGNALTQAGELGNALTKTGELGNALTGIILTDFQIVLSLIH
jgi:hypothetical protein